MAGPLPLAKRHASHAERNCEPIFDVLKDVLPSSGTILELASGTGQHVVHFAARLVNLRWQPSDIDPDALRSVEGYRLEARLPNVEAPLELDVREFPWPIDSAAGVVCCNMIHISPWECTTGLFRGAARLLGVGDPVVLYGPFRFHGAYTSESNAAFDAWLKAKNVAYGVRDLEDLESTARDFGFTLVEQRAMPANNHCLVWRRH